MSELGTVKDVIYSWVKTKLNAEYPAEFPIVNNVLSKLYWLELRTKHPNTPYVTLNDIEVNDTQARTEHILIQDSAVKRIKERKEMIVTIGCYNLGTSSNLTDAKRFSENVINFLRQSFKTDEAIYFFHYDNGQYDIMINEQGISNIRDLTSFEQTTYNYRYEFDISFGFDALIDETTAVGQTIDVEIDNQNTGTTVIDITIQE